MNHRLLLLSIILIFFFALISCSPSHENGNTPNYDETAQTQPGGTAIPTSSGDESPDGTGSKASGQSAPSGGADAPSEEASGSAPPEEWPEDIPIYQGLTIRSGQKAGENGYMLGMVGDVPGEDVLAFYDSLEGWESAESESDYSEGIASIYTRGDEDLEVYVRNTSDGIMVRLTYYNRSRD